MNTSNREEIITCKFKTVISFHDCGTEVMCREYLKYFVTCYKKKHLSCTTFTEKMYELTITRASKTSNLHGFIRFFISCWISKNELISVLVHNVHTIFLYLACCLIHLFFPDTKVHRRSSVQIFVSLSNKTSLSSVRSKMQWSLYLLILMGQCCFFTCRLYEYHFIEENKSWSEAQRYCREKYTDLAKVFDMTDMSRLRNSTQNQGEAWIGLNNNTGGNRTWHWSLPGVEYIQNDSSWNLNGRTDKEKPGNCGRKRDKLADVSCDHPMWFICYDGEEMWTIWNVIVISWYKNIMQSNNCEVRRQRQTEFQETKYWGMSLCVFLFVSQKL